MSNVALVTGGTRGIGAAISVALKAAGHSVAANYAGNDAAAEKFTAETGIPAYKWSVTDYAACAAGAARIEAEHGPIGIVVANAGITRDAPFHRMTPAQWQEVIDTNPHHPPLRDAAVGGAEGPCDTLHRRRHGGGHVPRTRLTQMAQAGTGAARNNLAHSPGSR